MRCLSRHMPLLLLLAWSIAPAGGSLAADMEHGSIGPPTTEAAATSATAPGATTSATGQLALDITDEEGHRALRATLRADGKPVADATVLFRAQRTFGAVTLGHDVTQDDGTAEIDYPADLPADHGGRVRVFAIVTAPARYSAARAALDGPVSGEAAEVETAFPRALWAPQAPWPLIATVLGILAVVWCTYAYVLAQLVGILRGGKRS